ncbi:hypothetical protein [Paraburkholderia lycopersici]|uniref:Lipoprotein n=1 Tax=Paraburkholderia lycopersici TaxID=416944 RepID=A0A1G7AP08_9BURK|nr:hypothetical protein [Paraburkholderia lycopersici]SDE16522.1 hypothetical protein SAMN05421548_13516 [Paraburkholderia lycopersici]
MVRLHLKVTWLGFSIMKRLCCAAFLIVLTVGCASPPPDAHTDTYMLHAPYRATPGTSTSKPPRLTVGVSDPDTQLILPWFLNDIINFVNYR